MDDDQVKQKSEYLKAMAAKKEKELKKNSYVDAEEQRIKDALNKRKTEKGLNGMRPKSPPKTVEERNERLKAAGCSTISLKASWTEDEEKLKKAVKEAMKRKKYA
jgi:hypothetical protein